MKKILKFSFSILAISITLLSCKKEEVEKPPIVTPPPPPPPVYSAVIPDGWKAMKSFDDQRNCATTITVGERIFVGLGYSGSTGYGDVRADWYEYNIAANKWDRKADFPGTPRANAISFAINGKAYVGLGTNYDRNNKSDTYTDLYEYDPGTDKWTKKKDFAGVGRDQPFYFTIGNKGYIGTGNPDPRIPDVVDDFWEYDPATDKWTEKAKFTGVARCRAFGFSTSGFGFAGAGENRLMAKLNDVFRYDPANNKWELMGGFPILAARAKGFSFGENGYVTGGLSTTNNTHMNSLYKYDTKANTWSKEGDIAVESNQYNGRFYQIATATKTKVYIGLGGSGVATSPNNHGDFYEYTPK